MEKQSIIAPKRILFYRGMHVCRGAVRPQLMYCLDGVSEGQFKQVLEIGKSLYMIIYSFA